MRLLFALTLQYDAMFAKTFVKSGNELVVGTCFILHKLNPFCIIFKNSKYMQISFLVLWVCLNLNLHYKDTWMSSLITVFSLVYVQIRLLPSTLDF